MKCDKKAASRVRMARRNRTDQFLKYREAFRAHGLPSSSKSHEMQELKGKAKLLASGIAPARDRLAVATAQGTASQMARLLLVA